MKRHRKILGAWAVVFGLLAGLDGCAELSERMGRSPPEAGPAVQPVALSEAAVGSAAEVPSALRTPASQSLFLLVSGRGVQVYECSAGSWALKAPEATLVDAKGTVIGKHYAGPTWESTDGSTVVGAVAASQPSNDDASIPRLLLNVKSTTGTGVFKQTRAIQRLQTVGGMAPKGGCGAGETKRVPYAATYAFFRVAG